MATAQRREWDLLAIIATLLAFAMLIVYVVVIANEGDRPVVWVVISIAVGGLLTAYAASRTAPARSLALMVGGLVLVVVGVLGLFSIGLPILVGGVLALVAAVRARLTGRAPKSFVRPIC